MMLAGKAQHGEDGDVEVEGFLGMLALCVVAKRNGFELLVGGLESG